MPTTSSSQNGQPRPAIRPAGLSESAATAAIDASSQFEKNDNAVRPRLAARRSRFQALAANIGTPVSSSAPTAITVRMMVTLVRKSRALIRSSSPLAIVEAQSSAASDKYLTFLSGSSQARAMTHNEDGRHAMIRKSFVAATLMTAAAIIHPAPSLAQDVPAEYKTVLST